MATIHLQNAPFINKLFYVTTAFGEIRPSSVHRGIDLAPSGYAGSLYAIDTFNIQYIGYDASGYGNYFIANNGNGMMYLYAHMRSISVSVGDIVQRGGYVGESGTTGSSTGVHLHLEMQQGTVWRYQQPITYYTNPCDYLVGIDNVATYNTSYIYDGIVPPTPTPTGTNKKFKWVLYARKLRTKYRKSQ